MKIADYKNQFFRQLSHVDKVYWLLFSLLIIAAVLALFSASSSLAFEKNSSTLGPIMGQMIFVVVGVAMAFVLQFLPTRILRVCSYVGLALSIIFLLLTFTSMGLEINGAKRWLRLFGITFQPSELAKLSLILVVGDLLSRIKSKESEKKIFFIALGITAVVCGLILIGNLSTALLLGGIIFLLFFLARVDIKYWGTTLLVALVFMIIGYFFVKIVYVNANRSVNGIMKRATVWVKRVDAMIEEAKTPTADFKLDDDNYQRTIAKVAIARGGASPIGVLPGNSQERNFLPQAFSDYIFAIIVEEWGIIGATLLMLLYLAILFRSCLSSSKYADYAAMLMVMGLALMLTCQALVSMLVAVGIGPVTGQPLPMISRGGTSALITSLYFGIMMCVAREQNELHARQSSTAAESVEEVPTIDIE